VLVKAALFTGCRYGELARLLVKDVNLDTGMVYISPEAKSGKGRHVPLHLDGADFFKSCIAGKVGKDRVFLRADGDPWGKNHHVRLLKAANTQASIEPPVGFHELRHTYASTLAQMGVDLLSISKLLGHADTRITSRHYAHLCDATLKAAVAKLPSFGHQLETKVRAIR
jgi:integrase